MGRRMPDRYCPMCKAGAAAIAKTQLRAVKAPSQLLEPRVSMPLAFFGLRLNRHYQADVATRGRPVETVPIGETPTTARRGSSNGLNFFVFLVCCCLFVCYFTRFWLAYRLGACCPSFAGCVRRLCCTLYP